MRKVAVVLGCVIAALLTAAGIALAVVDADQFRGPIQGQLERALHRKVSMGRMTLKLVPLSIGVDGFAIAEDPAFEAGRPFVGAKQLYVRAGLAALLHRKVDVEAASLRGPVVELVRNKAGLWNYTSLGGGSQGGGTAMSLRRLSVEDGTIAVTDQQGGKGRTVYDQIALSVDDYVPGQGFRAEGSGHTAGPPDLTATGTATVRGDAVTIVSELKAADARLKKPVEAKFTVAYGRSSGKAVVEPLEIRMDRMSTRGRAEVESAATPMLFRGDLRTEGAAIADLLEIANAFGMAKGASASGLATIAAHVESKGDSLAYTGTISSADATVTPSAGASPIHFKQANVRLNSAEPVAGHVTAGALGFDKIALEDASADFRMANGVFGLSDVRARAFGGSVTGNMAVDTRGAGSKIASNLKLANVDAARLLDATTAVKSLSGSLSGDSELQLIPVKGKNAAAGLDGTVRILLTDGKLAGVHVLDQLASVAKFLGDTKASKSATAISRLAGTMRIQSGVARTDDLQLDFDGGSLTAQGAANLADETLDLAVAAILTKDMSAQVGGSKVGGWMTTVMATPRGELVIPARVQGTFSNPRFQPDPTRLVKMKFGTVGGAAGTAQSVLDMFTKPKTGQPAASPSAADKAKPWLDLLDSFGKKEKK